MSSDTLHTKYRPTEFGEVIGQPGVVKSIAASLKKDTSHAFLLHGPSGTGKTTLARIAAAVLGCEVDSTNFLELDAATFTGIDDMRQITSGLRYKPFSGCKVVVVDECHALSRQAWSSLLKSIEEPPKWLYWFFCTTELAKVPENIKTRCARFELKPIPRAELFELVTEIAKKEKIKVSEGILDICAKEANGSPRQAIVNLGMCAEAKNAQEAAVLLKSAGASPEAVELARALLKKEPWSQVQKLLAAMKDMNAESVRHVVRAYMTNLILSSQKPSLTMTAMAILDEFGEPFPYNDGISPVVLACGRLVLS